jgi:hypothetical protein
MVRKINDSSMLIFFLFSWIYNYFFLLTIKIKHCLTISNNQTSYCEMNVGMKLREGGTWGGVGGCTRGVGGNVAASSRREQRASLYRVLYHNTAGTSKWRHTQTQTQASFPTCTLLKCEPTPLCSHSDARPQQHAGKRYSPNSLIKNCTTTVTGKRHNGKKTHKLKILKLRLNRSVILTTNFHY